MDLREQGATGHQLGKDWKGQRAWVGNNQLFTKTAQRMHEEIWKSNPHDWHIKSPQNRLNGGDWKANA